jgi:hypothetical protein
MIQAGMKKHVAKLKPQFTIPQLVLEAQLVLGMIKLFLLWVDSSNQPCLRTCS